MYIDLGSPEEIVHLQSMLDHIEKTNIDLFVDLIQKELSDGVLLAILERSKKLVSQRLFLLEEGFLKRLVSTIFKLVQDKSRLICESIEELLSLVFLKTREMQNLQDFLMDLINQTLQFFIEEECQFLIYLEFLCKFIVKVINSLNLQKDSLRLNSSLNRMVQLQMSKLMKLFKSFIFDKNQN